VAELVLVVVLVDVSELVLVPLLVDVSLDVDVALLVLVLVDGEIGPTKLDLQMLDWARANGIPHTIVATKMDKVRSAKRPTRKKELAAACQLETGDIVWVSSSTGVGIDDLRSLVLSHLAVG